MSGWRVIGDAETLVKVVSSSPCNKEISCKVRL